MPILGHELLRQISPYAGFRAASSNQLAQLIDSLG
jgi:hypothetical protein